MSLILRTDARVADELSDALLAHGVQSVSVEDANAGTDDEAPLYGEPGMPVEVIFLTGERSMLTYLLHPLTKRLAASMKEE